eukprot:762128-Hanusia_phi.AAC.21
MTSTDTLRYARLAVSAAEQLQERKGGGGRWRRMLRAVNRGWTGVIRLSGLDSCGDLGPFVFVFVFLWFFGVPLALIYILSYVPMYDPSGWRQVLVTKLPISLYVATGFFFPLARILRSMRLTDQAQLRQSSSSARDNISNRLLPSLLLTSLRLVFLRLVCLALVVELWQLVALAFGEGMPYDGSGFAQLASPAEGSAVQILLP